MLRANAERELKEGGDLGSSGKYDGGEEKKKGKRERNPKSANGYRCQFVGTLDRSYTVEWIC